MPADELSYFEEETEGEYVGIGVEIKITAGAIVIVRVLPHTSAADALLQPGDKIVAIDDTPTTGFTIMRSVELMRGPEGSTVSVLIEDTQGAERRLTLERRAVTVSPFPIHGVSRSGSAYIRWTVFTEGSADRLAALVETMLIESPIGLILDLRGNPGGLLDEAVSAAGIFLPPDKLVCSVIDRSGLEMEEYRTGEPPATYSGPLVVVIDEYSASASEVLAAALQESGRAVVIGRRSFGKGWVQNVFPFDDGSALRLSTARYYTPAGHTFGDPSVRLPNEDSEIDSTWFEPSGLVPDSTVAALPIGTWEESLAQNGVFADFAVE
jgi:carboxyl-terminal processing protease